MKIDRRGFLELSAMALVAPSSLEAHGERRPAVITMQAGKLEVKAAAYSWSYSEAHDVFQLHDARGRLMVRGPLQPAVTVEGAQGRRLSLGKPDAPRIGHGEVEFTYRDVNGSSGTSLVLHFGEQGFRMDPITYRSAANENVVSLHYFAKAKGEKASPALECSFFIVPGISESPVLSPIVDSDMYLDQTVWLGRGGPRGGLLQQWGLPSGYLAGFSRKGTGAGTRDEYTQGRSGAFVCGLADLPNGDFMLTLRNGKGSPWIDYRSDLWKFLAGPGPLKLGATLLWAIGAEDYDAIGRYYDALAQLRPGIRKSNSARKTANALRPQFCTWGAQVSRGKTWNKLDEPFLVEIYREMRSSGMKAELFSIDADWEASFGSLQHSVERFPHFEALLDRVRADGLGIGLWAPLMCCEKPSDLGLTEDNMLKRPDGSAYRSEGLGNFYILDCTQPKTAAAVADACRRFIRRYKPDLVKFDFGYEVPPMAVVAPQDRAWAGERFLWKGLDVAIGAMKQENPDLVVMYDQLSPLFGAYLDLHSPDDLFLAAGGYDIEANRRFYFSSLLGRLGVPTYGSSGYDWASMPSIWLDSAVVGTLGSLNDFKGDERGESSTPDLIAKYNGLAKARRASNQFRVEPIGSVAGAAVRGAHATSWVRIEAGKPVLVAFRPPRSGANKLSSRSRYEGMVRGMVRTDAPVLVASRTHDGVEDAAELAVVAYGEGAISIRRRRGTTAKVMSHYFDGSSSGSTVPIANGELKLTAQLRNRAGAPLEWMEVHIA